MKFFHCRTIVCVFVDILYCVFRHKKICELTNKGNKNEITRAHSFCTSLVYLTAVTNSKDTEMSADPVINILYGGKSSNRKAKTNQKCLNDTRHLGEDTDCH